MSATWPPSHASRTGVDPLEAPHPLRALEKLPKGFDAWVDRAHGWYRRRGWHAAELWRQALACHAQCESFDTMGDVGLTQALAQAKDHLRRDPLRARGLLLPALALVAQMAWRVLGMRPYPVQLMGALALHEGWLAEMATGEGKTLTVALSAVLAGWSGRPCHVITANDYLAERDAQTMQALFAACGVSLASVHAQIKPEQRPSRYAADVVYVTPKELLADYLRDRLAADAGHDTHRRDFDRWLGQRQSEPFEPVLLMRGLHTAIVDEADSVLIDEAVTPLILSARRPGRGLSEAVTLLAALAPQLEPGKDYERVQRTRSIELRSGAIAALGRLADRLPPVWRPAPRREELLRQALQVHCFFSPGHQYLVQDGEIVLLDEFTGRMTPGRTLTAGLHQAIEAKEGVAITDPNESLSQMSFQAFFRGFARLSGSSGTAWEAVDELWRVYRLPVVRIPTHRRRRTVTFPLQLAQSTEQKWRAVAHEVLRLHGDNRPVLVGVRSVQSSLILADLLRQTGMEPAVLNAVEHDKEADIVAAAGQPRSVTIATNMAGRGTDIKLHSDVEASGGLHVIIAEINESARIDRQLAGRCGRQGDPGSVSLHLCLEDNLAIRYMPVPLRYALRVSAGEVPPLIAPLVRWAFARAQARAESDAFARRFSVLRHDDWLSSALPFEQRGGA
jgi:preprotein translocase subunit SecA